MVVCMRMYLCALYCAQVTRDDMFHKISHVETNYNSK